MEICITFGGKKHCFFLPIYRIPIDWGKPGPGPVNYPALFQDALIVSTINDLAHRVGDDKLRDALASGVQGGLKAMQGRVGKDVSINMGACG